MLYRLRRTPSDWRPTPDTVRFVERRPVLGSLILGFFGLPMIGGGAWLCFELAKEVIRRQSISFEVLFFALFSLFVLFGGALMVWLSFDSIFDAKAFAEIDFGARRYLLVRGDVHVAGFEELSGLALCTLDLNVIHVTRSGDSLGSTVRPIDRLVLLPSHRVLLEDTATVGPLRAIASRLANAARVPMTRVVADAPAPLPRGISPGQRVSVLSPRGAASGYVVQGTFRGATSRIPNVVVLLQHGESVMVEPHCVQAVRQ